jgi:Phage-related protein
MDTFTWKPIASQGFNPTFTAQNVRIKFDSAYEQVQRKSVNTEKVYEFTVGGTADIYTAVMSFWESHAPGGIQFYYTPPYPNTTQYTCRFSEDGCSPVTYYSLNETGDVFGIVGFTLKVKLKICYDT